jgi:AcrR family transcriptional regulator
MDLVDPPLHEPRGERADAVRNREHLLQVVREMVAELGPEKVTMDGLAERAGLGKGTVFRRFCNRAGIFHALIDADERAMQERVLCGPPPLGPGAEPIDRLIAYGRARIVFLLEHHAIVRAALDPKLPVPAANVGTTPAHIRMLLDQARKDGTLDFTDIGSLTLQLTAALEGTLLFYLTQPPAPSECDPLAHRLADSWQVLVEHLFRQQ